ncbi:MAG: DUF1223 domain-containing protein [Acidobacteriota bacterium]
MRHLTSCFVLLLSIPLMASAEPTASSADASPVVVELFTSQGCSSCPPADRLLTELADAGDEVLPLSFHVDYWNYIGWTDPFSAATWSERQRRYGRTFRLGTIYTPQLVVDGRFEGIGSDADKVRSMIDRAREQAKVGRVALDVRAEKGGLVATVDASLASSSRQADGPLDLVLAVVERDLVTPVNRGENARRTLRNDNVVRRLVRLDTVSPGAELRATHQVDLDADWQTEHLGLVAFLQDPRSLAIHGADGWRAAD